MALRKLEEEMRGPLFDRSERRHYTLTEAGETLYTYAQRILGAHDEALMALDTLNRLERGRLRSGQRAVPDRVACSTDAY